MGDADFEKLNGRSMSSSSATYDTESDVLPHTAFDVERQVLGAALLEETACAQVVDLLSGRDGIFANRQHHHPDIFDAIERLFSQGDAVNMTTVQQETQDVEGTYLMDLTTSVGAADEATVEHQCRVLIEKWMERQARDMLQGAVQYLSSEEADIFETIEGVQRRLHKIRIGDDQKTHVSDTVPDVIQRAEEWREGIQQDQVPTGLYGLDRAIGGFPTGELTTIAGQTGSGKTSLVIQVLKTIAKAHAENGEGAALFFSAEMNREQVVHRASAAEAGIDLRDLQQRQADRQEYERYTKTAGQLSDLPWHIDDRTKPTFTEIAARAQRVQMTDGLSFIAVDYDEKVEAEGGTEELRVANIARGLKDLAKRFEVPVVAISQYSRSATGNTGMPKDGWLRYSGKKEQESAMVIHWYWPGYFIDKGMRPEQVENYEESAGGRKHGKGWMVVTKNRFGRSAQVPVYFQPKYTRFLDPADPETNIELPDPKPTNQTDAPASGAGADDDAPF